MKELLSNLPVTELNEENDLFRTLSKGKAIKAFLESEAFINSSNKMVVLYGTWGSGKTTLMRYLEKNIDTTKYTSIFFEAWQHEKDENLGLSLAELIRDELPEENTKNRFWQKATKILLGFTKGISIKLPVVSVDVGKITEAVTKPANETSNIPGSFLRDKKEFKETFWEAENEILEKKGLKDRGKIIVFVDDLDRCEPENVLNLISAIKLFFTYGKRSMFFCGIDKNAISKAVETKYNDVIKSDEYLEKVFDISFNMPIVYESQPLLDKVFNIGNRKIAYDGHEEKLSEFFTRFFTAIWFTNPRHIKKVINKYRIICSLKSSPENDSLNIPEIIIDGEGKIIDTLFTLFFIILYEYHPDAINEIRDYEEKAVKYANAFYASGEKSGLSRGQMFAPLGRNYREQLNILRQLWKRMLENPISDYIDRSKTAGQYGDIIPGEIVTNEILKIIFFGQFLPQDIGNIEYSIFTGDTQNFIDQFKSSNQKILVHFCGFLNRNFETIFEKIDGEYSRRLSVLSLLDLMKTVL